MDKISVIVPVYNAERYLRDCIDSILHQTHAHFEVILVNDGSKDGSATICDEYVKKDSRIRVRHMENSGVSVARNTALEMATGDFVTFVDSDDWLEPEMLTFAIGKAEETQADIVIWSYFKNYFQKEIPLALLPGGDQVFEENKDMLVLKSIYAMYGEDGIVESISSGTVWGKLYRKDFLDRHGLCFKPGLTRAQDTVFSIQAFQKAKRIAYFDKSLYHYRITNSSTCSGTRYIEEPSKPFNMLLGEFRSFIDSNGLDAKYEHAFHARTVQVLMWHLKHRHLHPQAKEGRMERRRNVARLVGSEPYASALRKVDLKLLPRKERLMVVLYRHRLYELFHLVYRVHEKREQRKERKYA